jgi:hypothetical protein
MIGICIKVRLAGIIHWKRHCEKDRIGTGRWASEGGEETERKRKIEREREQTR